MSSSQYQEVVPTPTPSENTTRRDTSCCCIQSYCCIQSCCCFSLSNDKNKDTLNQNISCDINSCAILLHTCFQCMECFCNILCMFSEC